MKHCFTILFTAFLGFQVGAQGDERRSGELLVQVMPGVDPYFILAANTQRSEAGFQVLRPVVADWRIYLIGFDESQIDAETALKQIQNTAGVAIAQFNRRVYERDKVPDDQYWDLQDDMTLMGAPDAWEYSTGGLTPNGDTIVIAVMEKGALLSHPDLAPNRWYNWQEIPQNGIDDDGNGYVDDFKGWNPRTGSDFEGTSGNHGTAVNGILGAGGNNEIGVSGVNWQVKLLNFGNIEFEDEIVAAAAYVQKMRKLYNETNGQKGAFVVAVNNSFGKDKAKAAQYPLWCAAYDQMGAVGVLSAGATTNTNTNVDTEGDMPTTCSSEFLIAVTNVDPTGKKAPAAGYGEINIDLGAPGTDSYTTANLGTANPGYTDFDGTSAATPHVAGAIALVYSLQCASLTSDALSDPVACARRIRNFLLYNTTPEPSLDQTSSMGRLDLTLVIDSVNNYCQGIVGPLGILKVRNDRTSYQIVLEYQAPDFDPYSFRVFNMLGQLVYEEKITPRQFAVNSVEFDMANLPAGVYVFSLGRGKVIKSIKIPKF